MCIRDRSIDTPFRRSLLSIREFLFSPHLQSLMTNRSRNGWKVLLVRGKNACSALYAPTLLCFVLRYFVLHRIALFRSRARLSTGAPREAAVDNERFALSCLSLLRRPLFSAGASSCEAPLQNESFPLLSFVLYYSGERRIFVHRCFARSGCGQ